MEITPVKRRDDFNVVHVIIWFGIKGSFVCLNVIYLIIMKTQERDRI